MAGPLVDTTPDQTCELSEESFGFSSWRKLIILLRSDQGGEVLAPVNVQILRRSGLQRDHVTPPLIWWRPAPNLIWRLRAAWVDPNSVVETPPESRE